MDAAKGSRRAQGYSRQNDGEKDTDDRRIGRDAQCRENLHADDGADNGQQYRVEERCRLRRFGMTLGVLRDRRLTLFE